MKISLLLAASVLALASPWPITHADVISDWNKTAYDYLNENSFSHHDRGMAMVHISQFDAVNAVLGGYTPYALEVVATGASPEAAAAQAAYTILTNISRASMAVLNSALARSLAGIPAGVARDDGIRLGQVAASRIIQLRAADNPDLAITPPTSSAVGKWRITPPNSPPGVAANSRYMLPWTMRSPAQFRPGPPPGLNSAQYAADLNEVRRIGVRNSGDRTPSQTEAAAFHHAGYQAFLQPMVAHRTLPLIESARMFALFHMIAMDTSNAALEAQYAYSFWRPITAIRLADTDGNDATAPDPAWNPLFDTPNHPEYPSATCTDTSGLVTFLISIYGDDFPFTTTNSSAKPRSFERLSAMVGDAVEARIAAGAHYRNSCLVAVELGRKIAENALNNYLRPVPQFSGAARLNAGEFQLHLHPGRSVSYVIETSGDLSQWTPWQTNIYGSILRTDTDAGAVNQRFYRVLIQP